MTGISPHYIEFHFHNTLLVTGLITYRRDFVDVPGYAETFILLFGESWDWYSEDNNNSKVNYENLLFKSYKGNIVE